jgi:hypothetical protein
MTAKNAVRKKTDLTIFSLIRETCAVHPAALPVNLGKNVIVRHPLIL